MSCCNACAAAARFNPPDVSVDDFAADLAGIDAAYERLGHWWLVAGVTKAAGIPAGGELDARVRGLVGEPPDFHDLETAGLGGALARAGESAWAKMEAGAVRTLEFAGKNKILLTAAVAGVIAWRALDLEHAEALETVERDGAQLETLFNQMPEADRAKVLSEWGKAHFGRDVSGGSGIPTALWWLGGGLALFLAYKALK